MRAFGWLSAISLALAGCAEPPQAASPGAVPRRVVSLNLCTDELLLALAEPGQIASVTHLAGREEETHLWRQASAYPLNDGTMEGAVAMRPDLVLTMGGGGGDRIGLARRLGIRTLDLPFPQSLEDEFAAIRAVAHAVGRADAGEALVSRIEALRRSAPQEQIDTIWVGGGGRTVGATGQEAQWMALAGYRQREMAGDLVQLEELLARPPSVLLRSDYRARQYSRGQAWLAHPLAQQIRGGRTVTTDGRRWTCMGPALIEEIERLKRERGA